MNGDWIERLQQQIIATDPDQLKKLINEQILNSLPGENIDEKLRLAAKINMIKRDDKAKRR